MYCCHCGKKIDEGKIEGKKFSSALYEGKVDENTTVEYVCPRCGHLIHHDVDEREIKTLAAAREQWAKETCYIYPGPIQYFGPTEVCDQTTVTLQLEQNGK